MSANIEHLRAVGRAATEGPWVVEVDSIDTTTGEGGEPYVVARSAWLTQYVAMPTDLEDAEFCATARNEWDGLLDEVEALRAKVARVEEVADTWLGSRRRDGLDCYQELRAALADESAQDGLSRAGTTSVASGAAGDVEGREIGAQDEGGKA